MLHVYPFKSQKPVKASRTLDPYKLSRLVFKPLRTSPDNLYELIQGLSDGFTDQEPGITLAKLFPSYVDFSKAEAAKAKERQKETQFGNVTVCENFYSPDKGRAAVQNFAQLG